MRAALVALLALFAFGAAAAGWGTITPGESTTAGVKTEHGEPSKVTKRRPRGTTRPSGRTRATARPWE